ncbi:unnamed protein product, partial [Protopolystoma xenopodis]
MERGEDWIDNGIKEKKEENIELGNEKNENDILERKTDIKHDYRASNSDPDEETNLVACRTDAYVWDHKLSQEAGIYNTGGVVAVQADSGYSPEIAIGVTQLEIEPLNHAEVQVYLTMPSVLEIRNLCCQTIAIEATDVYTQTLHESVVSPVIVAERATSQSVRALPKQVAVEVHDDWVAYPMSQFECSSQTELDLEVPVLDKQF